MCLGFGGCCTVEKAPPEFLEDRFCELRVDGTLRSSASGRGTSKRKEGDVVLLFPALPYEGVEFLQAEIPQRALLTLLGNECPKPGEAEHLTLRIVGLYQIITVEEDALARSRLVVRRDLPALELGHLLRQRGPLDASR